MLTVDPKKCTQCGICLEECRGGVLVPNKANIPEARYPEQCNVCGHCVAICPTGALIRDDMPYELCKELSAATLSAEVVRDLLLSRRSVGVFKERPVPKEMIELLIVGGIHAGTASNAQSESFIVIQDKKALSDLENIVVQAMWDMGLKYMGSAIGRRFVRMLVGPESSKQVAQYYEMFNSRRQANELKGTIFRNAPAVVVTCGLRKNPLAATNCALALRNMEILALPMGLGTCWSGFLMVAASRDKRIARLLQIPDTHNVYGAIMAGFPKHTYRRMIPRKDRDVRWI